MAFLENKNIAEKFVIGMMILAVPVGIGAAIIEGVKESSRPRLTKQELIKNIAEQEALAQEGECAKRIESYGEESQKEICEEYYLPLAKGLRQYPEMAYSRKQFKDEIKAICEADSQNCGDNPRTTMLTGEIVAVEAAVRGQDPNEARETYLTSSAKSKAYIKAERQKEYWDTHNKNMMRIYSAGAAATMREEDRRQKEEAKRFSTTYSDK